MNKPIINHTFETSDKDTLKEKLMQMPELEIEPPKENRFVADPNGEIDFTEKDIAQMTEQEKFMNGVIDKYGNRTEPKQDTHKRLNIHTFMTHENEVCLGGTDENGQELCIWFDSYEFIEWIDKDHIKEKLTKYIKQI